MSKADAKYSLMDQIGEIDVQYVLEAEYTEKELKRLKEHGMSVPVAVDVRVNEPTEQENAVDLTLSEQEKSDLNANEEEAQPQKERRTIKILWTTVGIALTAAAILLFVFLWNPDRSDVVTTTDGSEIEETTSSEQTTESDDEVVAKPVRIDEEHFPDEVFRKYVSEHFDYDQDEMLSVGEIEGATAIWVEHGETVGTLFGNHYEGFKETIHELTGIEYLTSLQLLACSGNELQTLDISRNPELTALDCSNNKLTELDVSHNPKLSQLICSYNSLTQLDVSENPEFSYLRVEPEVTVLDAGQTFRRVNPAAKVAKPEIIDQPGSGQAAPNEMVTLSVKAVGEGELSYQWQYNIADSTLWSDFEQIEAKSPTFSIEMKEEIDNLRIRCKVKCDDSLPAYSDTTRLEMIIPVTPAYFPDDNFRDYISRELDQNHDGILRSYERDVSVMDVSNMSIQSLKGIEYFPIWALNCSHNQLTNLDVSGIETLRRLYCSDNRLTEINLSSFWYFIDLHLDPEVIILWNSEDYVFEVYRRYDASELTEGWYITCPRIGETTNLVELNYFDCAFGFTKARVDKGILCLEGNLLAYGSPISFPTPGSPEETGSSEELGQINVYGYDDVRLPLAQDVKLTLQTYYSDYDVVETDQKEYAIDRLEEALSEVEQKAISYNQISEYESHGSVYLNTHYTGEVVDEIIIYAEYHEYPPREEDIE